jgi:hypothetical protein
MAKWNVGPKNGMWKGGRTVTEHGYVLIRVGKDHPLADVRGYAYEHRLIAEQKLGRRLKKGEIVHHNRTGKIHKKDNSQDNLKVCKGNKEHFFHHRKPGSSLRRPGEQNRILKCPCGCGKKFRKFDSEGRPRRWISGHNPPDRSVRTLFLEALTEAPKTLHQLKEITGQSLIAVKVMASKLVSENHIKRISRGIYGR